jgi:hypothetical protein
LSECSISLLGTLGMSWFPHEDVSVSPKEAGERVFLFWIETCPDHGSLATVAHPEVDGLHLNLL